MPSYRVYWLDSRRRIVKGAWVEAENDEDANRQAAEMCGEPTCTVELWLSHRPVSEIDCSTE